MQLTIIAERACEQCGKRGAFRMDFELPQKLDLESHYMCSLECVKAFRDRAVTIFLSELLPIAYQKSNAARIPDQEAMRIVMKFERNYEGEQGLYLYGKTGAGKTRSACMKVEALVADGCDVAFVRGKALGDEIVSRTRPNGKGEFEEWFNGIKAVDVLAIDEFDKLSFTPRVRAEIFELIEHRASNQLPTIYTAQCRVDRLATKFGKDGREEAEGIIRRIKENSIPIHFTR